MTDQEASLNVLLSATAEVVDDLSVDLMRSRDEVTQLRGSMEARAPIEQARGMLMMRYGLPADNALRLLLRWSKAQDVEPHVLAGALVELGINEGLGGDRLRSSATPGLVPATAVAAADALSRTTGD